MGWGRPHTADAGTTGDIERAMRALHDVGITGSTLAEAALRAAEMVAELRGIRDRHVRQEDTAHGAPT